MAFLLKAIGFRDSVPGFPYTPNGKSADVTVVTPTITWTMRSGECAESNRPVTIFSTKFSAEDARKKELACMAMKRAKSLLLPGILRCYGAAEHRDTVYLATEPCQPLCNGQPGRSGGSCVNSDGDGEEEDACNDSIALGLKTISSALIALHQNSLIHGNVARDSVFILPNGEWRLFGLELVSGFGEVRSVYLPLSSMLPEHRRPPETLQANYDSSTAASAIDSWGLACLIYEVLALKAQPTNSLPHACRTEDVRGFRKLPRALQSGYNGLCAANPKMRHSVAHFLKTSDFIVSSEFVQCIQMLEDYSLKSDAEREQFMEHLSGVVDTFHRDMCKCLVLQKLQSSFTFGILPSAVSTVVKIATRVTSSEEYDTFISPVIVTLFRSRERMVRLRILQHAADLLSRMSTSTLNEVWTEYVAGFSSPIASIREHSARALVPLARVLDEKKVVNDVPQYIAQLQQDPEGPIRTNATIALCLIADVIPAEHRSRLLVHRFGRMLKDPFVPSRTAALRSFHTTLKYFSPQHVAELLIPSVAPLVMDGVSEIRSLSLDLMRAAVARLSSYHKELLSSEKSERTPAAASGAANNGLDSSSAWDLQGWGWGGGDRSKGNVEEDAAKGGSTATFISMESKGQARTHKDCGAAATLPDHEDDDCLSWSEDTPTKPGNLQAGSSTVDIEASAGQNDPSALTDSSKGSRVMKLRKKGIGASRLS
uniref:Uncharacterized protein TCIL3000_10_1110 n=1 Tax=Trypanosoma congolense (strain IL3000) TaxID=1068625 RepID=G0UVD7_TRYCI|nr:unnamed protein product [Trypanosoma congolense IL3000]